MAKNDNLTDFLTNVADAIRYKKNTSEKINPQDFFNQIITIGSEGGDSGDSGVTPNAVRFFDYDGTLLHSYSVDGFLSLTELPELPTREGFICQGWNYSISDAQSYVVKYRKLDIGATYITDDGKTRLYIKISAEGRMTVPLYFSQTVSNGVTIDWGDGSTTETVSGKGVVNTSHTYANIGEYVISLSPVSECSLSFGESYGSYMLLGSVVYCSMLQVVEIGKNVTSINTYAFHSCYSLTSVVIPNSVTSIGTEVFRNCRSLTSVVIPNSVTSIGSDVFRDCYSLTSVVIPNSITSIWSNMFHGCYSLTSVVIPNSVISIYTKAFRNCYSLKSVVIPNSVTFIESEVFDYCYSLTSVVIPNSVTSIKTYTFRGCRSLTSVVIPNSVTSIGGGVFSDCYSLTSVVIPNSVTSINTYTFSDCYSLTSVVIPNSVTSIGDSAFGGCYGMGFYDFSQHTSVPTLGTSVFSSIPSDCKIVVPDSLYDSWIAATNWSTYASNIVKASEFDG